MCNNNSDLVSIKDNNIPFKDYQGITRAPDFNGNGCIWAMIVPGPENPPNVPSPTLDQTLPNAGDFQATNGTPYADNCLYSPTPNSGAFTESMGVALWAVAVIALLRLVVYSRLKRKQLPHFQGAFVPIGTDGRFRFAKGLKTPEKGTLSNMSEARGSQKAVVCDYCHRRVPQSRAIVDHKPIIDKGLAGGKNFVGKYYRPTTKLYLCFKCAKRRGVLK